MCGSFVANSSFTPCPTTSTTIVQVRCLNCGKRRTVRVEQEQLDAFNADAAEFDCSMGFIIADVLHTGCETPEAALQELSLLIGSRHALREPNNGDVAPMRPVKRKRRVLSDDDADDETDQPTPTIKRGHISVGSESDPSAKQPAAKQPAAKQPAAKQPEQPQRTVRDSSDAASEGTLPASFCLSQRLHQWLS